MQNNPSSERNQHTKVVRLKSIDNGPSVRLRMEDEIESRLERGWNLAAVNVFANMAGRTVAYITFVR